MLLAAVKKVSQLEIEKERMKQIQKSSEVTETGTDVFVDVWIGVEICAKMNILQNERERK